MKNIRSKWITLAVLCLPLLAMPLIDCGDSTLQSCDQNTDCPSALQDCINNVCVDQSQCAFGKCDGNEDCTGGSPGCSDGCCIEPDSNCDLGSCVTHTDCAAITNGVCAQGCCVQSN